MDIGIISKRYAKALYAYALEVGEEKTVYVEMQALADSYSKVSSLRSALINPVLTNKEKLELLCASAGGEVCNAYRRFATLVLEERREEFMHFIACSYMDLYRKKHNICIGKLTTAVPMRLQEKERMQSLIARSVRGTVEFQAQTDASLLGGFVLEIDSNRLDASVATQIRTVQRQLVEKNKRIV